VIEFVVSCNKLHQHIFDVELKMDSIANSQEFMLPNWIAGSYKIRDYARNITNIAVKSGEIEQISKNRYKVITNSKQIILNYSIYGFEKSVRHSYLDENRAFFNGNSIFLLPIGFENNPFQLVLNHPNNWQVATSLTKKNGIYFAKNYDELLDSPVEIADFKKLDFDVNNIPHSLVITGNYKSDDEKLTQDLTKICNHHQQLFGSFPVEKYLFLTLATFNEFGGLEHTKSTSLICSRKELNNATTDGKINEDYTRFLSLCSHEYFHTWWIKSLKPKSFHNLDLENENYTKQLWIFEGITSYYDDYSLYLCGLIDKNAYLKLFAKTVNRVLQDSGNLKQSIAGASFNAWTQLYQMDENTQNSFANYYSKSALVAFLLDVEVQKRTKTRLNLKDVVKKTYNDFYKTGLKDDDFQGVFEELTSSCFKEFFADFVYGIKPLPLKEAFDFIDVNMLEKPPKASLGCEFAEDNNKIIRVKSGSVAEKFGIYKGDEIVLIDGEKTKNAKLEIEKFNQNDEVNITIIRDNIQITKNIILDFELVLEIELCLKNGKI
jgi:predicted metalloprotease with PDZ domain